jgi:hypothetical protein
MVFDCPWGCGDEPGVSRGLSGGPFHQNAWECPKFASRMLAVLQALANTRVPETSDSPRGPD